MKKSTEYLLKVNGTSKRFRRIAKLRRWVNSNVNRGVPLVYFRSVSFGENHKYTLEKLIISGAK